MLSSLTLVFFIIIIINIVTSNVCIWGRTSSTNLNVGINGLYIYEDDLNNNPSYKKTTDCSSLSTLYLYSNTARNQWRIAEIKGSDSYIAYCSVSTGQGISECGNGDWMIAENGSVIKKFKILKDKSNFSSKMRYLFFVYSSNIKI